MLSLNLRQIQILDHLLRNEISHVDDLLSYVKISSRTLQSNIVVINSELAHGGYTFTINTNHNRGYSVEPNVENHADYDHLKAQCESYLDNELTCHYGDNPRVSYIIREFLCTNDFIKAEDLVEVLNISLATLTNDMRLVRSIFNRYQIILQSIPYYGMKILGDPYAIRSCLLDFCDIYDIYASTYVFEQVSIKQYNIDMASMHAVKNQILCCLTKHHVHLSERGFRRLFFYILIKRGGYDYFPLEVNEVENKQLPEHLASIELGESFQLKSLAEIQFIKNLMLASQDHLTTQDIKASDYHEIIEELVIKINNGLKIEIHLDLMKKPHAIDAIRSFIFSFLVRKKYHLYELNNSMKMHQIMKDVPVSGSLSTLILEMLCFFTNEQFDRYHSAILSLRLFNAFFVVPNEYEPVRTAYIGNFDLLSSISVGYRMETSDRYNIQKDFYSSYETESIDWSKYDCALIVCSEAIVIKECTIPIFHLDYFVTHKQRTDFFERVLAKKRVENFLLYKTDNKVDIEIANKNHKYVNEIVEVLSTYGYTSLLGHKVIENLIKDNLTYYQFDPFVICLMWNCELEHTLFIFHLKTPEKINEMVVRTIQIVIMDPNDNVLAIKQADSYVRRMQRFASL